MNRLVRKVASVGVAIATVAALSGVAPVFAQTAASIQAQINQLLATIQLLQTQLAAQGGSAPATTFTRNLTVGSTGADVKALQQWLNANGYPVAASGVGSVGKETQYFGPATRAAVAKYQVAKGISPTAGYFGPTTRASVNAAGGAVVTPGAGVVVPATGLAVSLASDTPAGSSVPKSAANVPFLKFNIAGSGTVTQVVVKRVGAGATTDFGNVYLYDGSNRLTSGRSVNSSTHEATFSGINVAVSGVKTLTVSADIAAAPGAGNKNAFQVTSVASTAAVTGLPVMGNEVTNSSAQAGTITIEKSGSVNNPNIGAVGAQVSQFRLTPASEDAKVSRIALFFTGTLSKTNASNFTLKDAVTGNTLATVASVNAKDLVVFEFATPYTILKGDNKLFNVYADIAGTAKSADTMRLYVDEASDVYAVGQQYGYGMAVTKMSFDSDNADNHLITLQGGTFTISFTGPNAGDIAKNGKDVSLYEFSLYSAVTVEVRKVTASMTFTTVAGNDEALADVKIVDKTSGLTVAGPLDAATGNSGVAFTDYFTINKGQTRSFKITADIPNTWDEGDAVKVTLGTTNSFGASDVKNLDNNTFLVPADDISPSGVVAGNTMTVRAPTLSVNAAALPATDGFVKGKPQAPLVGISLRASNDNIKISSIKVSASATLASGTIAALKADFQNLGLYDGTTLVSDLKSLTGTTAPVSATFTNLNYTVNKGETKTLVLKANISSSATTETSASSNNGAKYAFGVADVADTTGVDVVAVDSNGNEPTYSGDLVNTDTESAISGSGTVISVLPSGALTIATAASDTESKAGVVVAGSQKAVLGKFNFTATSEDLTVTKLTLQVDTDATTTSTTTVPLDEVAKIYLYDGSSPIGSGTGYIPIGDGNNAGQVVIQNLSWLVPKDTTKTLTVKADINTMAAGADTGTEVRISAIESGFEATGSATTLTTLTGSPKTSAEKVVYKTYPIVEAVNLGGGASMSGTLGSPTDLEFARFKVRANSSERIEWGAIGVQLNLLNASFSDTALSIRNVTDSVDVAVGTQAPTTSTLDLTGDSTKSAILYLTTPEQIVAGGERVYAIKLNATAAQFGTAQETETLTAKLVLHNDSSTANLANAATFSFGAGARVDGTLDSADNAFVWSDFSASNHAVSTSDWANGVYVDTFPSAVWTLTR